jgi:hypothetical protein
MALGLALSGHTVRVLEKTRGIVVDLFDMRRWRQSGEAQKLLYGEMGNLHDLFTRPQIMHFSYFSAMEVPVLSHPPLQVNFYFYYLCP